MSTKVIDNDRDEITVTLDGAEIRGWSYESEIERRWKMRMAREFCEGWHQATERTKAERDLYEEALCNIDAVGVDFGHFEAAARTMQEHARSALAKAPPPVPSRLFTDEWFDSFEA